MTSVNPHSWSQESLLAKAVLYAEQMQSHPLDDWRFGLWSSLTLEVLARAALAHISPVLLADQKEWRNLMHALGSPPTAKKYKPTSISMIDVLARLTELVEEVTPEVAGFCTQHADRRNSELHTGELAFAVVGTSQWLPKFYRACDVLLRTMGQELWDLFDGADAKRDLIKALEDETAKAVAQDIKAHGKVWANKSEAEREQGVAQADAWARRTTGHRVVCPGCQCSALVQGTSAGPVTTKVIDDEIVAQQSMLPSVFQCVACGLKISGYSRLTACGRGDAFTATSRHTAADYFELYTEDDLQRALAEYPEEVDFNE